jgi:hypothetical protein
VTGYTDLEESKKGSKDEGVKRFGGDQECRAIDGKKESLCGDELKSGHQRQKAGKTQEELVRGRQEPNTTRRSHHTTVGREGLRGSTSEGNPPLTPAISTMVKWNEGTGETDTRRRDLSGTWVGGNGHG